MNFRIAARVVSQLGAELISSDEIAIYELVKNGFDASSKKVEINIQYRVSLSLLYPLQEPALALASHLGLNARCPEEIKELVLARLADFGALRQAGDYSIISAQQTNAVAEEVRGAKTIGAVLYAIGKINSIDIVDYGHGMTPQEVEKFYLTIGTTHRLKEVEQIKALGSHGLVPTGEKGIGRLSAMRLGYRLDMFTVPAADGAATFVSIPWREFVFRREEDIGDIEIPHEVKPKRQDASGTYLSISDLASDWPRDKAERLGSHHLAKFIDPFPDFELRSEPVRRSRAVVLKWNGEVVDARELIKTYCDHCQNSFRFRLRFDEHGRATLESFFHLGEATSQPSKTFRRDYTVVDFSEITEEQLRKVGPFEVMLFHFPRNRLKSIPQFASRNEVKRWLDRWSGGLMVFRDGVRVLPYASEGDDWLELDSRALRGRGFRVNRIQVVGCVRIGRLTNPGLVDQTNREGLRDTEEYRSFKNLISRHLQENFVNALKQHLSEDQADMEHLTRQIAEEYDLLTACADKLSQATKTADWGLAKDASAELQAVLHDVQGLNDTVERALQEKESNRIEVLELAATGMAAEAMAHDLVGLIETAVTSLNEAALTSVDQRVSQSVQHIRAVHKSLLVQVKQIDPGPAIGRRRASRFELTSLVREVASFFRERLTRHQIELSLPDEKGEFYVHAVNGHIRQVLDNLVRNSIYWLEDTRKRFPDSGLAAISITADPHSRSISFTDSGIGIAREDKEWVFRPFTSRKERGRGLGLFICRELCDFNNVRLSLDENSENRWGRFGTFRMEFSEN